MKFLLRLWCWENFDGVKRQLQVLRTKECSEYFSLGTDKIALVEAFQGSGLCRWRRELLAFRTAVGKFRFSKTLSSKAWGHVIIYANRLSCGSFFVLPLSRFLISLRAAKFLKELPIRTSKPAFAYINQQMPWHCSHSLLPRGNHRVWLNESNS